MTSVWYCSASWLFCMPMAGMHIGAEIAFEGAGMNKPPMILSLIHGWLMVVPFMYILGPWLGLRPRRRHVGMDCRPTASEVSQPSGSSKKAGG